MKLPDKSGYKEIDRKEVYRKALSLYNMNEFIRPAINTIVSGIFSDKSPDFRGTDDKLVELAWKIVDFNKMNFHDISRDAELAGDSFAWIKPNGDQTKIIWLNPGDTESVLVKDNLHRISGYKFGERKTLLSPNLIEHIKFNTTSTSQYGRSSMRQIIYWIDVLDDLFEKNWLRGAQYFGNPLLAITGVPGPYQQTVKSQIEAQVQRAGRSWVLPPDTDIKVPDFTVGFPIGDIVFWVFRMISIATELPITLFGTADAASRGTAFFATPRFELAIRPRREVWRIGLRSLFIKIFKSIGELKDGEEPTRKEFDIGFTPMFLSDFDELADFVEVMRDRGIISKKSVREMVGL